MPGPRRFPFLDHPLPLAFAHRGAHGGAGEGGSGAPEENTPGAFERAAALGYTHVETDVQASRDGVAAVFHDDDLARVFGRPERVRDLPWSELARLQTPSGQGMMRLEDALASFPDMFLNLDPKTDRAVEPLAEAVRRAGAVARVCAGSFDVRRTLRLRRLLGDGLAWSPGHAGVARLWLAARGLPAGQTEFPAAQVPPRWRGIPVVTRGLVREAERRGAQVHVWTVDEPAEMERLLGLRVHGIMTDRAALLRDVLRRRGAWHGREGPR